MEKPWMPISLEDLGWSPFFMGQCSLEELETLTPTRLFSVQKNRLFFKNIHEDFQLDISGRMRQDDPFTIGDWFLLDDDKNIIRRLTRKNVFKRVTSAKHLYVQLAGANMDTLFIVTSCNNDFNLARLERYLALAKDSDVFPVILLTKTDLCSDIDFYTSQISQLGNHILYAAVNATSGESLAALTPWIYKGQTIAFMGSSGVGKSTIVNHFCGHMVQQTAAIREDDSKGRHTTTHRSMHLLPKGGILLDSPGIRELQLLADEEAISDVFAEITELALGCKFRNCSHGSEPGCKVRQALEEGTLDQRRFDNYMKLKSESQRTMQNLHERRSSEKKFSKEVKSAKSAKTKYKFD